MCWFWYYLLHAGMHFIKIPRPKTKYMLLIWLQENSTYIFILICLLFIWFYLTLKISRLLYHQCIFASGAYEPLAPHLLPSQDIGYLPSNGSAGNPKTGSAVAYMTAVLHHFLLFYFSIVSITGHLYLNCIRDCKKSVCLCDLLNCRPSNLSYFLGYILTKQQSQFPSTSLSGCSGILSTVHISDSPMFLLQHYTQLLHSRQARTCECSAHDILQKVKRRHRYFRYFIFWEKIIPNGP